MEESITTFYFKHTATVLIIKYVSILFLCTYSVRLEKKLHYAPASAFTRLVCKIELEPVLFK